LAQKSAWRIKFHRFIAPRYGSESKGFDNVTNESISFVYPGSGSKIRILGDIGCFRYYADSLFDIAETATPMNDLSQHSIAVAIIHSAAIKGLRRKLPDPP
jgi:hypothetical protein